jgi:hypothetical protein
MGYGQWVGLSGQELERGMIDNLVTRKYGEEICG